MSESRNVDDLITTLLPDVRLPKHVRPSDLLDDALIPPDGVAERVLALRTLVRSGGSARPLTGRVNTSRDVAEHFGPMLARLHTETVWVVGLDARGRTKFTHQALRGSTTACPVDPAEIFRPAILNGATSIILVHNHPSGVPQPSPDDVILTERLRKAGELLGIRVTDHVIVGAEGYFSFLETGLLTHTRP